MGPFLLDQVEDADVFRKLDSRRLVRLVTVNEAVRKMGEVRNGGQLQQVIVHVRQPLSFYSVLRTHPVFVRELSTHLPAHYRLRASEPAVVKVELRDYLISTTNHPVLQVRHRSCLRLPADRFTLPSFHESQPPIVQLNPVRVDSLLLFPPC